jgi:hypothetical protein
MALTWVMLALASALISVALHVTMLCQAFRSGLGFSSTQDRMILSSGGSVLLLLKGQSRFL